MGEISLVGQTHYDNESHFSLTEENPMSTWDICIDVEHNTGNISGEIVWYGSWEDLDEEQLEVYINFLKKKGYLK